LQITFAGLHHVAELAPDFAPAFVELALVEWRLGALQPAYRDAHRAEQLEPWRAGYHILTGHILLKGKQPAMAATYSRYVASHWFGPDHNEAVDLWRAVPAQSQGEGAPLALDTPAGTEVATGMLQDVSCGTPPASNLVVTFLPDQPAGAKPMTFKSDGRLMIGFSDTFWWGEDHFSMCHHLAGHRALVAYKAQTQQLLELDVRDDLPADTPAAKPAQTAATSPMPPAQP
jgi:hypothetical protein